MQPHQPLAPPQNQLNPPDEPNQSSGTIRTIAKVALAILLGVAAACALGATFGLFVGGLSTLCVFGTSRRQIPPARVVQVPMGVQQWDPRPRPRPRLQVLPVERRGSGEVFVVSGRQTPHSSRGQHRSALSLGSSAPTRGF